MYNWCKLLIILAPMALSGCFRPEYPTKFVSSDPMEFEAYREQCASRPSPPARTSLSLGGTEIFITYSQPAVKERNIWGDLVPFGNIWRTGANEATVLSSTGDILINGDTLKSGNYALYTIPTGRKWTIILNEKYDVWGAYDYDQSLDVMRFEVDPSRNNDFVERMNFNIDETGTVRFSWEKLAFDFLVLPL